MKEKVIFLVNYFRPNTCRSCDFFSPQPRVPTFFA